MKTRDQAADILIAAGWKFSEVEKVLVSNLPPYTPPYPLPRPYRPFVPWNEIIYTTTGSGPKVTYTDKVDTLLGGN